MANFPSTVFLQMTWHCSLSRRPRNQFDWDNASSLNRSKCKWNVQCKTMSEWMGKTLLTSFSSLVSSGRRFEQKKSEHEIIALRCHWEKKRLFIDGCHFFILDRRSMSQWPIHHLLRHWFPFDVPPHSFHLPVNVCKLPRVLLRFLLLCHFSLRSKHCRMYNDY